MLNKVLALAGGDGLKRVNLSGHLVGHLSLVQRLYDVLVLFFCGMDECRVPRDEMCIYI